MSLNRFGRLLVLLGICCALSGTPAAAAEPGEFQGVIAPLNLPEGWTWGACSAVDRGRDGELFVFHRGRHPILCFDANGTLLRSWGDDLIKTAHGLRVDRDGNVWVTDIGHHRIFKFDPQGKLLLSVGTGKPGTENDQFNQPTDVAFGPDGEFYVSDGYGNSRVMKFSPQGTLIKTWGTRGNGPGEFHLPHAIVVDRRQRVLVGDRENNRIQVFDREGQWLETWTGFAPYGMALASDGRLFVATGRENDVLALDAAGKILRRWGRKGAAAGEFNLPHMLTVLESGTVYVAEVGGKRVQQLVWK